MKKLSLSTLILVVLIGVWSGSALATPTKIISVPSTDVQPYKTVRLGVNNYFRASGAKYTDTAGGRDPNTLDIGLTVGVLPFEKVRLEAGFDYLTIASDPNDQHPWSGNIKLATPENSICPYSPALAVGLYNARPVKDIATPDAPKVTSGQNIIYFLGSETIPSFGALPSLGRVSGGYYRGSRRALIDASHNVDNDGILLSWDRTMSEVSDKLWVGVDYFGGRNINGSVNFGFSWAFTRNVNLLFGYDVYTSSSQAGSNTFTAQIGVNFP